MANNGLQFNIDFDDYGDFIQDLRLNLISLNDDGNPILSHDIPILRSQYGLADFLNVTLITGGRQVIILIDTRNIYVIGYSIDGIVWVFRDRFDELGPQIPGSQKLHCDSGYYSLGGRGGVHLGYPQLRHAVFRLTNVGNPNVRPNLRLVARSLLVIIQMTAEASRFRGIANTIREGWADGVVLPDELVLIQNNWRHYSMLVQQLGEDIDFNDDDEVIINNARATMELTVDDLQAIRELEILLCFA